MHYSTFIASIMAAGAMAAPHYKVVTQYEYVTQVVTAGQEQARPTFNWERPAPVEVKPTTIRWVKKPKQTYTPAPAPVKEEPVKEEPVKEEEPEPTSKIGRAHV